MNNREIILKNVLPIALLGLVLIFSSCRKDEKKIIGKWKYKDFEVKSLSCSDPFMEIAARVLIQTTIENYLMTNELSGIIEFTKKGKVVANDEYGSENIATYEAVNNKLTIFDSDLGDTIIKCDYFISGKKMYWDIDVLEHFGNMPETLFEMEITTFTIRLTFEKSKAGETKK